MGYIPQCQLSVCLSMEDEWTSVSLARSHQPLSHLLPLPLCPSLFPLTTLSPPYQNSILQLATNKLRVTVYLFL